MENGSQLRFSGLSINDPDTNNNDNLFQVMKAVEAAESTIRHQVEENQRLRAELQRRTQELEKYKVDEPISQRLHSANPWKEQPHGLYEVNKSVPFLGNQEDRIKSVGHNSGIDPPMTVLQDLKSKPVDPTTQSHAENHNESSKMNGTLKIFPGSQVPADSAGFSEFSSPFTAFSPNRYQMESELDPRFNLPGHGLMPMTEANNSGTLWKQDLVLKIRKHEEEIMQLRKHLSEYSVKEAQIRNEKYLLEKRIAYMRLAFDQQQQDLVDAASKALTYRQDIIEENIRLTYALQDAQQERSTFVSSLLPLLAEYSLQPPVPDAQSIVSNVKVLFKHLQEKLLITESKIKESQYQLTPWRSDVNQSNFSPHSPSYSVGATLTTSNNNGLELIPQPTYSYGKVSVPSSDRQAAADWDLLGHNQNGLSGVVAKTSESDDLGRYSPLTSRNYAVHDVPAHLATNRTETNTTHYSEESSNKQVTFREPVSNSGFDDPDTEGQQNEREPSSNWGAGNSPYDTNDDPSSSYSPYLPPVLEEPSSSFSEAADDDPLPAIEGLQISGEAFPGRELQASGYSINGTTSCNFEWVRHLEDGSVNYIEGAKQPNYLITADDVDTYLAIEVQPLDNRKRKGELVKVFANEHRKITCEPEMQNHIEKMLYSGHASYKVSLPTGYLDIWEPATLTIKKDGYSIKCSGPSGAVVSEKLAPSTNVTIPFGYDTVFSIIDPSGVEHLLRADNNSNDISSSRDTIVLTLRLFIMRAGEKRKGKKKGLFFNK